MCAKTVTVNLAGDTTVEPNEAFNVTLFAPGVGVTVSDAVDLGTVATYRSATASFLSSFHETTVIRVRRVVVLAMSVLRLLQAQDER